jgi:hypothetical protein
MMRAFARAGLLTGTIAMLQAGGPAAMARECTAASGPQRVALLELYTSEGCDSCPPADQWISALPAKNLSRDRLLALAFHVDYWNYIGWIDRFAQARFSTRQRQHGVRRGTSVVYTPQFVLNGTDYRRKPGFEDIDARIKTINRTEPLADIRLVLNIADTALDTTVEASAKNHGQTGAQLFVALFENALVTAVKAGENNGRTLKHDFVVRELGGPFALAAGAVRHRQTFVLDPRWKRPDLHVAAFVQHAVTGDVWQALAASCH